MRMAEDNKMVSGGQRIVFGNPKKHAGYQPGGDHCSGTPSTATCEEVFEYRRLCAASFNDSFDRRRLGAEPNGPEKLQ